MTGVRASALPPAEVERFRGDLATVLGRPLDGGETLALAVSGGADSMALLALGHAAFPGQVIAASVDHASSAPEKITPPAPRRSAMTTGRPCGSAASVLLAIGNSRGVAISEASSPPDKRTGASAVRKSKRVPIIDT